MNVVQLLAWTDGSTSTKSKLDCYSTIAKLGSSIPNKISAEISGSAENYQKLVRWTLRRSSDIKAQPDAVGAKIGSVASKNKRRDAAHSLNKSRQWPDNLKSSLEAAKNKLVTHNCQFKQVPLVGRPLHPRSRRQHYGTKSTLKSYLGIPWGPNALRPQRYRSWRNVYENHFYSLQ